MSATTAPTRPRSAPGAAWLVLRRIGTVPPERMTVLDAALRLHLAL